MTIQVLSSTTDHVFSKAIRFITWSEFSHVEFVTPDNKLLGADASRGVSITKLDGRLSASSSVMLSSFECEDTSTLWDFANGQVGKDYDWSALWGMLIRRNWENDNKWFCSELIAAAAKEAGNKLLADKGRHHRITPRDLLLSPLLQYRTNSKSAIKDLLS